MSHRVFLATLSDAVEISFSCKSYLIWLKIKSEQKYHGIKRRLLSAWTRMNDPKISVRNITVICALKGQQL